ncbi:MAG: CTP synthase (glutamine hydrolyzing) [Candidatus Altiarchaeota archaeon]|nr:CTP synthase (glutamine hydrolyzing) [Candidatus Altiarchaeota archaeon]
MPKFIVVTGGVLSGLGKGVTTASIGKILQSKGFSAIPIKIDGYVNTDAGTMNPFEHGEVFVTDDGGEIDLDIGHYERFMNISLGKENNMTTGLVYGTVIEKERRGDYLGKTVQVIPHVTDEIKRRIKEVAKKSRADFILIEVGGTVGDLENMVFIEALRELKLEKPKDFLFVHTTLVPTIISGEQKTKPTQHSVKELLSLGIQPDIIVCRGEKEIPKKLKIKIALFCSVPDDCVISNPNLKSLYEVPLKFEEQNLSMIIFRKLGLEPREEDLEDWKKLVARAKEPKREATIGVVGKYAHLVDSYLSIKEALQHAGIKNDCRVNMLWIEAEDLEKNGAEAYLKDVDGVIVPGGFGSRGTEGKIAAIRYVRENNVPFLGICYGLHMAVVEFARNVCGMKGANTTEANPKTKYPVIDLLPEQKKIRSKGGTMRLGAYPCVLKNGSLAERAYDAKKISERHRHRWELNNRFAKDLEKYGLMLSGINPETRLVEIIEYPKNRYFIACQFHPEFKSRLDTPAPLFDGLIKASLDATA